MFNERMKALREEKGLYQKELAEKLSISRASIAMYESGERIPNLESLVNIADFFEVSLDYLLGRINNRALDRAIPGKVDQEFVNLATQIVNFSDDEREIIFDHIQFAIAQIKKTKNRNLKSK